MAKGKPLINKERCKGCALCITACPKKILGLSNAFNKQGVKYCECLDAASCIACTFCAVICPDAVIEIETV